MKVEVTKPAEMTGVAREVLKGGDHQSGATVLGLSGDLGAGKTTFTQQLAGLLGVKESVASPTFVIEKVYDLAEPYLFGFKKLIHIDAYRLDSGGELLSLGFKELLNSPHNLIIIEWPERVADVLPSTTKILKFKFINETTREVTYEI